MYTVYCTGITAAQHTLSVCRILYWVHCTRNPMIQWLWNVTCFYVHRVRVCGAVVLCCSLLCFAVMEHETKCISNTWATSIKRGALLLLAVWWWCVCTVAHILWPSPSSFIRRERRLLLSIRRHWKKKTQAHTHTYLSSLAGIHDTHLKHPHRHEH